MLVLSQREVEEVLDLDALVDALADAMASLSAGDASMPPRVAARTPDGGVLAAMLAYLPTSDALATKLVSIVASNAARGIPTHQAVIVAFDPVTGTPLAVMDGTYVTAARTAAGSALATRLLARQDASVLAVIGTGVQAEHHLRAVTRVGRFDEVRLTGRDPARVEALADRMAQELGVPVEPTLDLERAVMGADVVCACTHAAEPVVVRSHVSAGTHVNSVGVNQDGREVDERTVADALVVVESRASALAPFPAGANDLTWPIRDGAIDARHIHAEIGELVTGSRPGRADDRSITLYKSVGVAVQDAAAAALVLSAARERGSGITVEL